MMYGAVDIRAPLRRGNAHTLTFSMPKTLTFSLPINNGPANHPQPDMLIPVRSSPFKRDVKKARARGKDLGSLRV